MDIPSLESVTVCLPHLGKEFIVIEPFSPEISRKNLFSHLTKLKCIEQITLFFF